MQRAFTGSGLLLSGVSEVFGFVFWHFYFNFWGGDRGGERNDWGGNSLPHEGELHIPEIVTCQTLLLSSPLPIVNHHRSKIKAHLTRSQCPEVVQGLSFVVQRNILNHKLLLQEYYNFVPCEMQTIHVAQKSNELSLGLAELSSLIASL